MPDQHLVGLENSIRRGLQSLGDRVNYYMNKSRGNATKQGSGRRKSRYRKQHTKRRGSHTAVIIYQSKWSETRSVR